MVAHQPASSSPVSAATAQRPSRQQAAISRPFVLSCMSLPCAPRLWGAAGGVCVGVGWGVGGATGRLGGRAQGGGGRRRRGGGTSRSTSKGSRRYSGARHSTSSFLPLVLSLPRAIPRIPAYQRSVRGRGDGGDTGITPRLRALSAGEPRKGGCFHLKDQCSPKFIHDLTVMPSGHMGSGGGGGSVSG